MTPLAKKIRLVCWIRRVFNGLLIAGIMGAGFHCLQFLLKNEFHEPAYTPRMTIDSGTYLRAGLEISDSSTPWFTKDLWHGTGMQLVVGMVFRLGGVKDPGAIKIFNWGCWLLLLVAWSAFTWRVTRSRTSAVVVPFLISLSNPLQKFCATAQYEIVLTLIFCAVLHLVITPRPWAQVLVGIGVVVMAIFRIHFFLILPFFGLLRFWSAKNEKWRSLVPMALGFFITAGAWNLVYSLKTEGPVFFQGGLEKQIRGALNPLVSGEVNPSPVPAEPSGLAFILNYPRKYLILLRHRFQFLTSIKDDIWLVESGWTELLENSSTLSGLQARYLFLGFASFFLLLGLTEVLRETGVEKQANALFPLAILGAILCAQLVFNASNRYLVPVIPTFIFLQTIGVSAWTRRFIVWNRHRDDRFRGRRGEGTQNHTEHGRRPGGRGRRSAFPRSRKY